MKQLLVATLIGLALIFGEAFAGEGGANKKAGQVHVTAEGVVIVIEPGFDLRGEGGAGEGGA